MSDDLKTELTNKMQKTKLELSVGLKTELTNIMMEAMQVMFEDVKTELTEYTNKTIAKRINEGLVTIFFLYIIYTISPLYYYILNFDI